MRAAAGEMRTWLDHLNINNEVAKVLTKLVVEVKTEIRFRPTEDGRVAPETTNDYRIKPGTGGDVDIYITKSHVPLVDPSSGLPVYRQIMDQVRRMIVAGRLAPGDRLPSIRSSPPRCRSTP